MFFRTRRPTPGDPQDREREHLQTKKQLVTAQQKIAALTDSNDRLTKQTKTQATEIEMLEMQIEMLTASRQAHLEALRTEAIVERIRSAKELGRSADLGNLDL